jgi:hypothetical protein
MEGRVLRDERARQNGTAVTGEGEELETDATCAETTATCDEDKREEGEKLEIDVTGDENEKEQGEGDYKGETFKRIQVEWTGTRSLECDPSSEPVYSTVLAV